ncbi:ribosomal L7Ae/L30e/S12e/Gadd45 family protein [Paludicola sp. MB14-C6]|uniref:L7Ae/L30e/S12e/Gadd45 family ribosomal protein n=1 Tax=Paludihabitans sp. MB14-C6 TaxID=3070656 RepID=UPI0027DB8FDA|nr:ribosomal L7Ae/L30e/S12e/Gadd45 family protein [Paludicola sp. MB14-C6]WMJ23009.1 ribosomal L7Ae/L30e/S12e/Gadd45 family protein [Paludicola sp. MB14-C6]
MNKIAQDLSLCKRAGKLILGFDVVKKSMQDGSAELIVLAKDLSPKTRKETIYLSEQFEIPLLTTDLTLDELWYLLGKRVGVISVIDYGLSEKIKKDASTQNITYSYEEENR